MGDANVVVAIPSAVVAAADDEQELDVLSGFYADGAFVTFEFAVAVVVVASVIVVLLLLSVLVVLRLLLLPVLMLLRLLCFSSNLTLNRSLIIEVFTFVKYELIFCHVGTHSIS